MAELVPFPRGRVRVASLHCEACGGETRIFAPGLPVRAWCSPGCAAEGGLMPWAECSAEDRRRWEAGPGMDGATRGLGGAA